MSNNKQSSVEWLNDELASLNFDYLTGQIDNKEYNERHKEIIEQAKAMHKEEIIYATEVGYTNGYLNKEYDGHQHYKETFNQETK